MTTSTLLKRLRYFVVLLGAALLSACATTPDPTSAGQVSFGAYPDNYKQVVKDFLAKKPARIPLVIDGMQFLNEPNKFIFSQANFSSEKFGYRVCARVPTHDAYGMRSHFFLINNGKVTEHLHDSGLVRLSGQFCNVEMMAVKKREEAIAEKEQVDEHGFKYIVCHGDQETFFAFSPIKHQLIQQHDGRTVATYDIDDLSDEFIVANGKNGEGRISINRVSGTLLHQHNGAEIQSSCELTTKQKF